MRALRITAAILVTPILLFIAIIQIDQHLLRHRAEQLNADLQPLMRRPATWEDLQRTQTRWGRYGHYEGTCNADHCAYRIVLVCLPDRLIQYGWHYADRLYHLYVLAGGNAPLVQADLRLTRNHLWGIHLTIMLEASDTRLVPGIPLIARFTFGPRLFSYSGSGAQSITAFEWKDSYITASPGSCTGCISGYTSITPFTQRAQSDRVSKVDFACFTRYVPCLAIDQIFPAWKKTTYDESNWDDPRCLVPLDVRAREAANILLVQVTGNQPNPNYGPNHWTTNVQILDRLKNAPNEHTGGSFGIAEMGAFLNPAPIPAPSETSPSPPLPTGTRYFVLYPEERPPYSPSPELSTCSVTLATPENLALIQSGIAQDPSIGEPYFLHD